MAYTNGVLGMLGIKPEQYEQAQALLNAGIGGSLNNSDRLTPVTSQQMQTLSNAASRGMTYLNGDALVPGGPGNQNLDTPSFNSGASPFRSSIKNTVASGFGGVQSSPQNDTRPVVSPSATASSGGGLVQDVNLSQYNQNPYLAQMGTVLTNRVNDNLQRNILPSIRGGAIAAGGVGGSRQGVIEANALNDANRQISDSLTGINFQDFTNQMNRNLAQYGQNQNFFSNQRGQDLQQTALGANLFQQGNQGWLSQGQGLLGLGQTQQQAPWQVINNANAGLGQWSGYGTTTSANQGGGAQGVLGGGLAGAQLGKLWGTSPNAAGGTNSSGWGTGSGFGNQDFGQFF